MSIQHNRGPYAVINSGIGYCPSRRYMQECFDYCVTDFRPDLVIAEAQSINDWIVCPTPEEHRNNLNLLMDKIISLGAKAILMTVAPICPNNQLSKFGQPYDAFVAQSQALAQRKDIVFVDANQVFVQELEKIPPKNREDAMYVDSLHVNGKGHRIYADAIISKLRQIL